jgi:branched-chain amino acid transport system substrate-binding protein
VRSITALLAVGVFAMNACGSGSSDDGGSSGEGAITIGSLTSLTGFAAALGETGAGSVEVGAYLVNQGGGVKVGGKTYKFKVVKADAKSDPAGATAGALQLVNDNKVKFIFGPSESAEAVPAQAALAGKGVLWVTQSTLLATKLVHDGPDSDPLLKFTWAGWNLPADQAGEASVQGIIQQYPNTKRAAVIMPADSTYEVQIAGIVDALKAHGVDVVDVERYDAKTTDFAPILTKIKALDVDLVYTGNTAQPNQAMVSQSQQLGGVAPLMFATGTGSTPGLTGNNGKPTTFPYGYLAYGAATPGAGDPKVDEGLALWKKVVGKPVPEGNEDYAYHYAAPVQLLAQAMEKAGTVTDVDAIAKALPGQSVETPVGTTVDFRANHFLATPTAVCFVANGKISCQAISYDDLN